MQLSARNSDEVVAVSSDNKNKFNVGVLACSRLYKHKRIFDINDAPNYPDHNFPYANAKLVPSGYKLLTKKSVVINIVDGGPDWK